MSSYIGPAVHSDPFDHIPLMSPLIDDMGITATTSFEVRLIIFKGFPRPPLPAQADAISDLWVIPRNVIETYEGLLETLHQIGATQDNEQFAIMLKDGFKIHREFWASYVSRFSIFYVCIIQEDTLPPYVARNPVPFVLAPRHPQQAPPFHFGVGGLPNITSPIANDYVPTLPRTAPTSPAAHSVLRPRSDGEDSGGDESRCSIAVEDQVLMINACFKRADGNPVAENIILIRGGHTITYMHMKLVSVYQDSDILVVHNRRLSHLELRWGAQMKLIYPAPASYGTRVMDLYERGAIAVLDVVPIYY